MITSGLRSTVSVVAMAALTLVMPGMAFAQDAEPGVGELNAEDSTADYIIVTGTRASLAKGIDVKRQSDQFVDTVVAEDIGKLPDVNIAESLQRISGVQIQRSLGEGTQVSIRGLNQNITLANGREVVDAAGRGGSGVDSLGTGSYGLLAQLPSEIIQRLDVTKLAAASDIEGALSGTVNIITARPLASSQNVRAFSMEGLYNDIAGSKGFRSSALISQHITDNLAGLLNISYSDREIRDESVFSFAGFTPLTAAFDTGATRNTLGPGGESLSRDPNGDGTPGFFIADIRNTEISDNRKRLGVNGTLQWAANDQSEYSFDFLYSRQKIDRLRDWFALPLSANGNAYSALNFSPTETVISGVVRSPFRGDSETFKATGTTIASGLNGNWVLGRLNLSADLSYSRSKQIGFQKFVRLTSKSSYNVPFFLNAGDVPNFQIPAGVNLTDPSLFNFTNFFDNSDTALSELKAARMDGKLSVNSRIFKNVKIGWRLSELNVDLAANKTQLTGAISANTVPDAFRSTNIDILKGVSGYQVYPLLIPVVTTPGRALACEIRGSTCIPEVRLPLASYDTKEKNFSAYIQADIESQLGGVDISGNVGGRYVDTRFEANGSRNAAGGAILPVNTVKKYNHFLPSAAFKFIVSENLLFRLGAAKVIARPNSASQNPGVSLNSTPPFVGNAGNAELDPFRATQYDLSTEFYFRPQSILSLGLFKKDLRSFIVQKSSIEIYDGNSYNVNRPVNGANAKIKGIEMLFQMPFDFLPSPLDGLGTTNSYSYIDSQTNGVNIRTGEPLPITGLSKHNVNATVYWEKGPLGFRVAYNWRSKYLESIGPGGSGVFFDSIDNLSLSARFQITDQFSIDAQANNVLDSRIRKFGGVEDATLLYGLNGRTFSLGLRGKF